LSSSAVQSAMAKKATDKYQYSRLADIKEREIQNVYGVVKFKKAPLKSRGTGRDGFF
jgi:hypothetical protein